jgi:hypothetical protein
MTWTSSNYLQARFLRIARRGLRPCLVLLSLLVIAPAAQAQGLREGFVWSLGLGAAPISHWSIDQFDEEGAGLSMRGMLGFLVSRRNVLGFEIDFAEVSSSAWGDAKLTHGFVGPVWYHYYGRPGSSLITAAGIGFSDLDASSGYDIDFCVDCPPRAPMPMDQRGFGALAGVGYEFDRHWQCMAYFSMGTPEAMQHRVSETAFGDDHYNTYFISLVFSRMSD